MCTLVCIPAHLPLCCIHAPSTAPCLSLCDGFCSPPESLVHAMVLAGCASSTLELVTRVRWTQIHILNIENFFPLLRLFQVSARCSCRRMYACTSSQFSGAAGQHAQHSHSLPSTSGVPGSHASVSVRACGFLGEWRNIASTCLL